MNESHHIKEKNPTSPGNADLNFFSFKIVIKARNSSLLFHCLKQRKSSSLQASLCSVSVFLHNTKYCYEVPTWYQATECLKDDNFEPLAIYGILSVHLQPLGFYLTADYCSCMCQRQSPHCASFTHSIVAITVIVVCLLWAVCNLIAAFLLLQQF